MNRNTVTEEMIDNLFKNSKTKVQTVEDKCTIVTVTLENGCVITESSACVDKANYDEGIGRSICMQKIRDKLWAYEGYCLQKGLWERCKGIYPKEPTAKERVETELSELREKINRLEDVLWGKKYVDLNASEKYMLKEQLDAMKKYEEVLLVRIASWRDIPKEESKTCCLIKVDK